MNTITTEQQAAIAARLEGMILPVGLGTKESACSIAAINLALTGNLTDRVPDCMSEVIGNWIIPIQDAMPSGIRNSRRWKSLLPLAAGTGRDMERERLELVTAWLWGTVLPTLQPLADENGFGGEWKQMTTHRTEAAARVAEATAMAEAKDAAAMAHAAEADAAEWAALAAGAAADAADAAALAVARAADAETVRAAAHAARALGADAWNTFDPCDLLERMIRVGEVK
jgi:hypothetical protein